MNNGDFESEIEGAPTLLGGGMVTHVGLAVAGVEVHAVVDRGDQRETIASAVTDADGEFSLTVDAETLHRLRCLEEPVTVTVGQGRGAVSAPLSDDIAIELPEAARGAQVPWPRIAELARTSVVPTLASLAMELRCLSPTGVFGELRVSKRLAAYRELAEATQRALPVRDDGQDIEALPLQINTEALGRHNLADAIVINPARYDNVGDSVGDLFLRDWQPDTSRGVDPLIGYRDYLLNLLVVAQKSQMIQHATLTNRKYVERVENRFHQDFRTRSTTPRVAAENIVSVLEAVLTAPTGPGYGIALAASAIPPRGDLSAPERVSQLVGLTGLSGWLVENRWRIEVDLPAELMRSPVEQNIVTLQRIMTDTAQQNDEPWPVAPDLVPGSDIPLLRTAATPHRRHFHFLRYEEWLAQRKPVFFENLFDIRATAAVTISARSRELLASQKPLADFASSFQQVANTESAAMQYARCVVDAFDTFQRGVAAFAQLRHEEAIAIWEGLDRLLGNLRVSEFGYLEARALRKQLRAKAVSTVAQLKAYEQWSHCNVSVVAPETQAGKPARIDDFAATKPYWAGRLHLLKERVLPVVLAEAHLKLGNYRDAVDLLAPVARFAVMTDDLADPAGLHNNIAPPQMLADGNQISSSNTERGSTTSENLDGIPHRMEQAHNRLRLSTALLDWGDSLYRSDEPQRISRAREAYKAVMYLHGADPYLDPQWPDPDREFVPIGLLPVGLFGLENPAMRSHVLRARAAFLQIEAGLNFFGTSADYVPPVRYSALRQVAERFAQGAKAAQGDYLSYIDGFERGLIDEKKARASVRKAEAAIAIAAEEEAIATDAVNQVQAQINALKAQAAAKRKEYEENDTFWGQVTSVVSSFAGAKDEFSQLAGGLSGVLSGSGGAASTVGITDIGKAALSKDALSSMTKTLGPGFAATAGIALFVYKGVQGLESWTEGLTKLKNEYEQIEKVAIPAAEKTKALKQREVRITQLRAEVARADAELGRDLLHFYAFRVANPAFWLALARLSSELLTRYLDLGARHAWLAQQALAFEAGTPIRVVAMDYTNSRMRDIGGADRLLLHLAELEAVRIAALGTTVPVKWQVSLSSYAPRAFAELRATGMCEFATREVDARSPHPGLYGLRLRAIGVEVKISRLGSPPRGILANAGISFVTDHAGTPQRLVRYADGVALSGFSLREDMAVYSLPDEALLPFEGSGLDTGWRLELPPGEGLTSEAVLDVVITFDVRARYSPALHAAVAARPPAPVHRASAMSVQSLFSAEFADLVAGTADLDVTLDPYLFASGRSASSRVLRGIAVGLAGTSVLPVSLELQTAATTQAVTVPIEGAASSVGAVTAPHPLDSLVGADLMQPLRVRVRRTVQQAGALAALRDIVIAVDVEEQ